MSACMWLREWRERERGACTTTHGKGVERERERERVGGGLQQAICVKLKNQQRIAIALKEGITEQDYFLGNAPLKFRIPLTGRQNNAERVGMDTRRRDKGEDGDGDRG